MKGIYGVFTMWKLQNKALYNNKHGIIISLKDLQSSWKKANVQRLLSNNTIMTVSFIKGINNT